MTVWGVGHALISILSVTVFFLASWLLGQLLIRRCGLISFSVDMKATLRANFMVHGLPLVLLSTGFGVGVLIIVVEIMGMAHLLTPKGLCFALFFSLMICFQEWKPACYMVKHGVREYMRWIAGADMVSQMSFAVLGIETMSILLLDLTPVNGWDASVYHLTVPLRFLEAGGWINLPTIAHSYLYLNVDMLFLWALGLHGEQAAHLMVGALGLLTGLSIFAIARQVVHRRYALLAACMFLFVPLVWDASTDLFIDLGVVLFLLLSLLTTCLPKAYDARRSLILTAFFAGLAIGSKLTVVIFLPVILWSVYLRLVRYGLPGLSVAAISGIALLVPALVWPCRTFLLTGNPIYPFANPLFGLPPSPQFVHGAAIYTSLSIPLRILLAPWAQAAGYYSPAAIWDGGWGPYVLAFAPLAIFFRLKSWLRIWCYPLLISFLLYLILTPYPRYGLFLLAMWSIYAAYALQGCHRSYPALFKGSMIAILLSGLIFCSLYVSKAIQRSSVVVGSQTVEGYLSRWDSIYPVADWVNKNRVPGGAVLLIGERTLRFDPPVHVVMEFSPYFKELFVHHNAEATYRHWCRMGTTDVVVSRQYLRGDLANEASTITRVLKQHAHQRIVLGDSAVYALDCKAVEK